MARSKKSGTKASNPAAAEAVTKKSLDTTNNDISDPPESPKTPDPPQRKRRMASLNAEFFVRYSSSSYKNFQTPPKVLKKEIVTPKSIEKVCLSDPKKRKRTISVKSNTKIPLKSSPVKKNTPISKNSKKMNLVKIVEKKVKKSEKVTSSAKSKLNQTCPVELTSGGRPRREAGARASAMIIQTSEIEKSRFYSSSKNKKDENKVDGKIDDRSEGSDDEVLKVEQKKDVKLESPPAKALEPVNVPSKKVIIKKIQKKPVLNNKLSKKKSETSSLSVKSSIKNKDNKSITKEEIKKKKSDKLTEEVIKEHNTLNGGISRGGNNSFTSNTKTFIVNWSMKEIPIDGEPFEDKIIPLETYGEKILDQPQYLNLKKAKNGKNVTELKKSEVSKKNDKEDIFEIIEDVVEIIDEIPTKTKSPNKIMTDKDQSDSKKMDKMEEEENVEKKEDLNKNNIEKSGSSSLSESVHLVVDETPTISAPVITEKLICIDKPVESESIINENEKKIEEKSLNDVIEKNEDLENLKEKSPLKIVQKESEKSTKSVLNTVTSNIEQVGIIAGVPVLNDIKPSNVLSELMNESSNTNYSMED